MKIASIPFGPVDGQPVDLFTLENDQGVAVKITNYTGYYTSDKLAREDGTRFGQFRTFCCETSKYPNGPNIPGSPRSILPADQQYDETTVFKFGWEEKVKAEDCRLQARRQVTILVDGSNHRGL